MLILYTEKSRSSNCNIGLSPRLEDKSSFAEIAFCFESFQDHSICFFFYNSTGWYKILLHFWTQRMWKVKCIFTGFLPFLFRFNLFFFFDHLCLFIIQVPVMIFPPFIWNFHFVIDCHPCFSFLFINLDYLFCKQVLAYNLWDGFVILHF